jgi:ABC-type branched-subunit amino acid transport system substrate-binding protein
MILVRNLRQLLNGNKLIVLFTLVGLIAACSPKITTNPVKKEIEGKIAEKPATKFTEGHISVFIPFKLNQFNPKTVTKSQIGKADMALDFYQGLMLGIDSAANLGLNFKVNVFDSRDDNSQLAILTKKEPVKTSHLIIGPVFPDGLKYMTNFSIANDLPIVSPLAASKRSEFDNPNLISVVNDIDQHGIKIADYMAKHNKAENCIIVLINTKKAVDEQFALPIRRHFAQKYPNYIVQEYTSTYAFETKMMKGKKYLVVLCSSDVPFVTPSLSKLYKLKTLNTTGYDIQLFGHPNWAKQSYNVDQLQGLNTIISTSYRVDYKRKDVIEFVRSYRAKYEFEPSEYAFKGFDIGLYFGQLLAKHGTRYLDFLTKDGYRGLHNSFDFEFDPQYGYFNKHLMLLQYRNLSLDLIE